MRRHAAAFRVEREQLRDLPVRRTTEFVEEQALVTRSCSNRQLSEQQARAVRTIRSSAFSLLGLLDNILDFPKIEAGRLDVERAPVALAEMIQSACVSAGVNPRLFAGEGAVLRR